MPEYTIKCEDIMVMFKSLVSSLVNHTNQATNQTIPNEDNSFESDWDRTYVISEKIADIIGEKYSTVKYYMESMKKSGIIKREGSSQKGKWIIL